MNNFNLDVKLDQDSSYIASLELCQLRLVNNSYFRWVILVPQKPDLINIFDLEKSDRGQLFDEINHIAFVINQIFKPDRLNIGSLGNIVPQMHWHVIARFENDIAWPGPVWGSNNSLYKEEQKNQIIKQIKQNL